MKDCWEITEQMEKWKQLLGKRIIMCQNVEKERERERERERF